MTRQGWFGGALLALTLGIATACGGTDADADAAADDIATLETDATAVEQAAAAEPEVAESESDSSADAAPAAELTRDDALLEFSKCMRENGFEEFPDVAGGNIREALQSSGVDFRDPAFRETMQTCQTVMADAGFARAERTPEEQAELQEQQLQLANCIRNNGYPTYPDPDFDGDGGGRRGFSREALEAAGIDLRDEEFRTAITACRTELGIEGQGGRGAGEGAGAGAAGGGTGAGARPAGEQPAG